MKIKAEKWIIDGDVSYKILGIEKCCDRLINSNYIDINNEYEENIGDSIYSVKMHREESDGCFATNFYETINYCPFCGSPIFIEIVNTIDKTKEFNALRQERDIFWDKYKKTDSKKEGTLLKEQVKEIDKRTNDMLTSDNFEDYFNNNKVGELKY